MTLIDTFDRQEFSDDSARMFTTLVGFSPTQEGALVVLAAAAMLLARDAVDENSLLRSCHEFAELAEELRLHLPENLRQPKLALVGGTEHSPQSKDL